MAAGAYVHIPFCARRCGYCDFYSEVTHPEMRERLVQAILTEARLRGACWSGGPIDSVFIGGGTPTLLGGRLIERLFGGIREALPIVPGAEWTLEANPESAGSDVLDAALSCGANRLSLGVQSFDDGELETLGRLHDARGASDAVGRARAAGFRNLNIDLIYGLPNSAAWRAWESSLSLAVELAPEHMSCYLLDMEPHVPLARECASGMCRLPGERRARAEYESARRALSKAGYEQYEISNFALPGRRCLHNVNVWEGGVYLGLGPGAHGHHDGLRRANLPDLAGYIDAAGRGEDPPHEEQAIDDQARFEETLMLGLRLRDGIAWDRLREAAGPLRTRRIRERATLWTADGLLEDDGVRLRLGAEGLFVSNALMADLLGCS